MNGVEHGSTLSKYAGKWWIVAEGDRESVSGYKRLNIEMAYDPTIAEHVKAEGMPNFIHVVDRYNLKLIYLNQNKVYWFKRPLLNSISTLQETYNLVTDSEKNSNKSSKIELSQATRLNCEQMSSCEEALYYLNVYGDGRLDHNNNGVPCEKTVCSGELSSRDVQIVKSSLKTIPKKGTTSNSGGSNCHWVSGYTKKDGTRVRGYRRCN